MSRHIYETVVHAGAVSTAPTPERPLPPRRCALSCVPLSTVSPRNSAQLLALHRLPRRFYFVFARPRLLAAMAVVTRCLHS